MDNQDLDNLELYQLMAEIKPVTEPAAISMWPEGPGWTVLLGTVILIAITLLALQRFKRYKQRHRFYAIDAINNLADDSSALAISSILKRCALNDFERCEIAALTGPQWSEFLNTHCDKHTHFTDFYTLTADHDRAKLKQQAITWLTYYKVTP
ncbi:MULTISPECIES: DUF4381 domain-containing protein [Pseudoalteromonas]|uniref:DUF4381 domain-containing protein n=1 Tax=Pseudoalteromonas TaxID=53246 RepID=UPI0003128A26|nr:MULTISPECIES: DUF4381 domain-containing protein [Pseudoalteromonas]MCF6146601.1 hypothetical protein [Pseudoalteromonas mariniglutinosa NCIMB 1770]TMN71001.1 DUF4381 domain-containing protein [Pseudoalteromonas sp. S1727]